MDSIFDAAEGGERGESGDLWDEPDQTVENVKRVRHEQSEEAVSAHLGAGIQRPGLSPGQAGERRLYTVANLYAATEASTGAAAGG